LRFLFLRHRSFDRHVDPRASRRSGSLASDLKSSVGTGDLNAMVERAIRVLVSCPVQEEVERNLAKALAGSAR